MSRSWSRVRDINPFWLPSTFFNRFIQTEMYLRSESVVHSDKLGKQGRCRKDKESISLNFMVPFFVPNFSESGPVSRSSVVHEAVYMIRRCSLKVNQG